MISAELRFSAGTVIPHNLDRALRFQRRPSGRGKDGHALRNLENLDDAFDLLGFGRVEGFHLGAEKRRAHDRCYEHTIELMVDRVFGFALHLDRAVDTGKRFADDGKVLRVFQWTSAGTVSAAARSARSPNVADFPELDDTTPPLTVIVLASTPHALAAAATSMARAVAPALRYCS